MEKKRKDFTPKKDETDSNKKQANCHFVDLTLDDSDGYGDDYKITEQTLSARKSLSFSDHEQPEVKIEPFELDDHANDLVYDEQPDLDDWINSNDSELSIAKKKTGVEFYRDNKNLPVYSRKNPDIEEIFRICLLDDVSAEKYVKEKPLRIKTTSTFVVKQDLINLKHPYDLEADDTPGAFKKHDQVRFYEAKQTEDGLLLMSTEVHVTKNRNGQVIGGTYNQRTNKGWKAVATSMDNLFALIRKRGTHQATLAQYGSAFVRHITFVMPVDEYNRVHGSLKSMREYQLGLNTIIMHYSFSMGEVPVVPGKHGNAKKVDAQAFRPTQHSVKMECREVVERSHKAPRFLADSIGDAEMSIIESKTASTRVRNPKQVTNYRSNYGQQARTKQDDMSDVILMLLEQNQDADVSVLDDSQPFIREILHRHGHQPAMVAYTNQTLEDVARFCSSVDAKEQSPLLIDTTFNIAEYYFTQTAFQNLSVRQKNSNKHPWFPGPLFIHRNKSTEDFKYFWQAVKRGDERLEDLNVLGSDEDEALSRGILQETVGAVHLLGLEHVKANVERKLVEMSFPVHQRKTILKDIFGEPNMAEDPNCLYDSETKEEFDEKATAFKQAWDKIEKRFTKNDPPKFTLYFTKHKELQIRNKMAKYIRQRAGVCRGFGQNPVEWLHYMSKSEIDDVSEGGKHKDATLTTAVQSLKGRILRLYRDAAKAVYDDGPYKLDDAYGRFSVKYDTWMDLSQEEKEAHLKRFFVSNCCTRKQVQKNPIPSSKAAPVDSFLPATMHFASVPPTSVPAASVPADIVPPADAPPVTVPFATVVPVVPIAAASSPILEKCLSMSFPEFCIPEECIPRSTLEYLYKNAEALLNEPGAIRQAASSDPRMMTVKSRHGKNPLIVKPLKNGNQFECNCTTYKSLGVCQDTIAVANNFDCLKEYIEGLRKKLQRKRGKKGVNLTAAYNSRRKPSEQGLKANEISKVQRRKRVTVLESWKPTETTGTASAQVTTSSTLGAGHIMNHPTTPCHGHHFELQVQSQQLSQQQPSQYQQQIQELSQQQLQSQSQQQIQELSQQQLQSQSQQQIHQLAQQQPQSQHQQQVHQLSQQQPQSQYQQQIQQLSQQQPSQYQQPIQQLSHYQQQRQQPLQLQARTQLQQPRRHESLQWHSGMSPYRYEVCIMQNNIQKCYGCNQLFEERHRCPPQNVIIRHFDRRIRGITKEGKITYATEFSNTYYHCEFAHIARKNPIFDGIIYLSPQVLLSADQMCVLVSGNLTVNNGTQ